MFRFCITLILSGCVLAGRAQHQPDTLTQHLQARYRASRLPGFAVALINADSVWYEHGFGWADRENKRPYTASTIQSVGSVSKTLIGVALMQCVEKGLFTLDTPINQLLPFRVVNPHYPTDTSRVRHLATHTSGLVDNERTYLQTYLMAPRGGTVPISQLKGYDRSGRYKQETLRSFLASCLSPGGSRYGPQQFAPTHPGQAYAYTNMGAALAALIVETQTNQSYADYTRQHILLPAGMTHSAWSGVDIDPRLQAKAYSSEQRSYPSYTSITYPDGNLRTSCHELARYLRLILANRAGGTGLLTPSGIQAVLAPQFEGTSLPSSLPARESNAGLFWIIRSNGLIGHTGSDPGATAFLFFDPQTGLGRLLMTNIDIDTDPELTKQFVMIWNLLGQAGQQLVPKK